MVIRTQSGYEGTKNLLNRLRTELELVLNTPPEEDRPWLWNEQKMALEEEIRQLEVELKEFADTVAGKIALPDIAQLVEMPDRLLIWRLAKQWSLKELGAKTGIDHMMLFAYERTSYRACPFEEMLKIAEVLKHQTPENPENELDELVEE
jgi:hypothetical protein